MFFEFLHAKPCRINHLEISSKTQFWITYFLHNIFFSKIVVLDLQTAFFDGKTVFFRFLAEIRLRTPLRSPQKPSSRPQSCNFVPPCTLPKSHARSKQGARHLKGTYKGDFFMHLLGCFGSIWAHKGPYGPCRGLEEREKFNKSIHSFK